MTERESEIDLALAGLVKTKGENEINIIIATIDRGDGYMMLRTATQGTNEMLIDTLMQYMSISNEFNSLIRELIHTLNIREKLPPAEGCDCPTCTNKRNSVNPQNN